MTLQRLAMLACAFGLAMSAATLLSATAVAAAASQQQQTSPLVQQLVLLSLSQRNSHHRALADSTPKPCREYLTTQCSDSRSVCIKDCSDRVVQVLALQEAQDAYIATRGLDRDALGLYVDYRKHDAKLTLDSFPRAATWLFLSGLELNGKLDFDFPSDHRDLTTVVLAGERVTSIANVNFPDHVTTIKLVDTAVQDFANVRFPASLTMLDASSNKIESLSGCGFPDTLKHLYLSDNALTRLEDLALPATLETLAANWNRIAIIRNVTVPATLAQFYFVENPLRLVALATHQWRSFLRATQGFVTLDGEPSAATSCVTGYFGATTRHEFLACLLGEEPAYIENSSSKPNRADTGLTDGEQAS